ncbi:MAG: glycosyl transferase family 1 [Ardenticatenia bacterium]|jgi:rhamnosyl/mannosyltransferase|nr:MAG: glycosyl transferase family 1 [Ardenticatenia bacterium]
MHILHLYKDYFPVLGGIENHIRVLAEAQVAAGHQVTVLVCDPGRRTRHEVLNGVHVIKAGRLTTRASMPISWAQPWELWHQHPDLLHVHSPYPLGEVTGWLLRRNSAVVITHHSDVVRQRGWLRLYAPLLRHVLCTVDRIIATSPRYIETSPWLRPVAHKCVVVPLGVDVRQFTPSPKLESGMLRLLFVGRLRYYKGLDVLLRALVQLPDAQLTIVGDGPMRAPWETLARSLRLDERVHFAGDVPDAELPGWYRRADVFVLPANARAEAFGTVLLEAMASGLPCVTTEVGTGTSWIVQHGVTGLVVPPNDVAALSAALEQLRDSALRDAMGRAGRARVEQNFTLARMLQGVEAVYQDALKEAAARRLNAK